MRKTHTSDPVAYKNVPENNPDTSLNLLTLNLSANEQTNLSHHYLHQVHKPGSTVAKRNTQHRYPAPQKSSSLA